VIYII